jgi:hypothetical protein
VGAFLLALVFLCGMDSDAAVGFTRGLLFEDEKPGDDDFNDGLVGVDSLSAAPAA